MTTAATTRALFLDRDGVINVDHGYVSTIENFEPVDGIYELVRTAGERGFLTVVVTNQSGIARGLHTEEQLGELTAHMLSLFKRNGATIDRVYYCPTHPEATIERYRRADDPDRKPGPGMFLRARADLGIDLSRSAMIGDQWRDAVAAATAGVPDIAVVGEPEGPEPDPPFGVTRIAAVRDAIAWFRALP